MTAVGLAVVVLLGRAAVAPPAAVVPPKVERIAPAAAVARLLADAGGVVAFGELHQTKATAQVRSALAQFTDDILPVVAPRAAHLIVETWVTRGACGDNEARVTEDIERTTERPAATESEIVKLLRRAKELGVAPHVLDLGCDEYRLLLGGAPGAAGGEVDYDKLLKLTTTHLATAIRQALALPRPPGRPLVVVYGGALHNDLYPAASLTAYAFGRAVFALTRGAYREIDLYVPAMVDGTPGLKADPWFKAWVSFVARGKTSRAGADFLVWRSPYSAILMLGRDK
jgi:hypothetical protein